MKTLPRSVQQEIKAFVYRKADEHGYMQRDRIENGIFMDNLVKDPKVGVRLSEYMPKDKLKTYIKDAILNRYSKDKTTEELSLDTAEIIEEILGHSSVEIEKSSKLSFHRLDNNDLVVLSGGTFLKWETALRKALEYVAKAPGLPPKDGKLHLILNLATTGKSLTRGDEQHLRKALDYISVKVNFIGK
jgi:hypothetical protein